MKYKHGILFILFVFFPSFFISALEFNDGQLRLVLHPNTGRFSLYLRSNDGSRPQPLFFNQDPRTSFLSIFVNDRSFKMGDSASFRTSVGAGSNPSLIFQSSSLLVTQEFHFVRSPGSPQTDGLRIVINMENMGDRQLTAGARFLLDTHLGEGSNGFPITTDQRTLNNETLLTRADSDSFWADRNRTLTLTGSLNTGVLNGPDSVHIANWKRLNDVVWRVQYQPGRNFNLPPYSVGDTAVCYYFEPHPLNPGERRIMEFTLGVNSEVAPGPDPVFTAAADDRARDLARIRDLLSRIDAKIMSGVVDEYEISILEIEVGQLWAKYAGN